MLQAQRLVQPGLLLINVEGRHLRRVEHAEPFNRDLDLTGGQLGVGGSIWTCSHDAFHLDDPLVANRLGRGVRVRGVLRARYHLGHPVAIPQVEEGEVTMIAPAVHPPGQRHALTDMLGAQLAAGVGAEGGAHGSGHGSR